jgi:hypothetical protein
MWPQPGLLRRRPLIRTLQSLKDTLKVKKHLNNIGINR